MTGTNGRSGGSLQAGSRDAEAPVFTADLDAVAAVAAHRAMNALAVIAGTLGTLEAHGEAMSADERRFLLGRAIANVGSVSAVLHDVVSCLPIGASPNLGEDASRGATDRFGVGTGRGLDQATEVRRGGPEDFSALTPVHG